MYVPFGNLVPLPLGGDHASPRVGGPLGRCGWADAGRGWSGGDVLVEPVEDALAADAVGGWLAVRVCALFPGEADQRLASG